MSRLSFISLLMVLPLLSTATEAGHVYALIICHHLQCVDQLKDSLPSTLPYDRVILKAGGEARCDLPVGAGKIVAASYEGMVPNPCLDVSCDASSGGSLFVEWSVESKSFVRMIKFCV